MAYQLRKTCRKGLHLMTPGSYRLEETFRHGKIYVARRCRQCQSDRVGAWNKANLDRVKKYREKTDANRPR